MTEDDEREDDEKQIQYEGEHAEEEPPGPWAKTSSGDADDA